MIIFRGQSQRLGLIDLANITKQGYELVKNIEYSFAGENYEIYQFVKSV